MKPELEIGDEITCPECARVMVRCVKKPEKGMLPEFWMSCFVGEKFEARAGNIIKCPYDDSDFGNPFYGFHVEGKGYVL